MRDRLELRAQHPVAQCLIRRLMVPRVYFDAGLVLLGSEGLPQAAKRHRFSDAPVARVPAFEIPNGSEGSNDHIRCLCRIGHRP